MLVLDSSFGQRNLQQLLVKVRVTPGSGKAAHVGEQLDVERSQRLDELFEGMSGVADGPDFEFGFAHDKSNWATGTSYHSYSWQRLAQA